MDGLAYQAWWGVVPPSNTMPWYTPPPATCPGCGRCNSCGRPYPTNVPTNPYYPYLPPYTVTCGTAGSSYSLESVTTYV